jgi:hypothetical protein
MKTIIDTLGLFWGIMKISITINPYMSIKDLLKETLLINAWLMIVIKYAQQNEVFISTSQENTTWKTQYNGEHRYERY